jgi:DNA polymerase-1
MAIQSIMSKELVFNRTLVDVPKPTTELLRTHSDLGIFELPLDVWIGLIEKNEILGFDFETTGLKVYDGTDKAIGFSVAVKHGDSYLAEYFPIAHSLEGENNLPEEIWRYMLALLIQKMLVMHNAVFDITVARNLGFEITRFIDTMKYAHLLNENRMSYSLDNITEVYLGYKGKKKSVMFEMEQLAYGWDMHIKTMREYALTDAHITLQVFYELMKETQTKQEQGLTKYWGELEAPSLRVLTYMRGWGVEIDTDKCRVEEVRGLAEKARITEFFGFNPGSPIGLRKLLIEELGLPTILSKKTGRPTFDSKAMERYELMLGRQDISTGKEVLVEGDSGTNEIVRELLCYRGWTKSVSSYYKAYQDHISPDGRLRPEYKPHGTKTGRYSCANPNLQQIPKETDKVWNGAIKDCLVSAQGYTGWEIDYAQLEFRLAASASRSENLLSIFADPHRDIFTEMAKQLTWARQATKGFTYSTLYGAGVQRIMDAFGVDGTTAKDMIEYFYSVYPELRAASRYMSGTARSKGYVDIWSGRRRHFEFPAKEDFKAFNSYIQGGAADIMKSVMIDMFREIISEECRMLLQVHDSLWFEIAEGKEAYYLPKIMEIMRRPSEKFGVRLDVDAHSWSHREEIKFNAHNKGLDIGKVLALQA